MSELAQKLIEKEKREKSKILDLGKCGLSDLPKALYNLDWLEILILSNAIIDYDNMVWMESKNHGEPNKFLRISSDLSKLKNLKKIVLTDLNLNSYDFLRTLTQLTSLDLSSNQISNFNFLKKLANLNSLYLSHMQISDLSFLNKHPNLAYLDLSSNHISDLRPLKWLSGLKTLNLHNNLITEASALQNLNNLTSLTISNNQIFDLTPLKDLYSLTQLDLSNNKITDITPLEKLNNLVFLNLNDNQVQNIAALKRLKDLVLLDISLNQVHDLSPLLFLIKKGIPISLAEDDHGIKVKGCPLATPPIEIVRKGNGEIVKYYEDLKQQNSAFLYEAKLLIVGDGEAGKTTLAWKIIEPKASMPKKGADRTRGIDIQSFDFECSIKLDQIFRMHIWDFGGQEIYHSTHQFFLTNRSLYVIVNNTRTNTTDFNHWLQMIELLSNSSPVIIVQNIVDESSSKFDLRGFQTRFSNIVSSKYVDLSKNDKFLHGLIAEIKHQVQQLNHVGSELPKQWVVIREQLKKLAKETPYISLAEYFNICRRNRIVEKEAALRLSSYLHDLGVFLHFQNDMLLRRTVFLQNNWATKGVYKILDNKQIEAKNGHFTIEDAELIWQGSEYERLNVELLKLMQNFELCYEVADTNPDSFVSPQLLSPEKPNYDWNNENNLIIIYEYDFLPKGLLGRLMVRLYKYIKDHNKLIWKSGVIFHYQNTEAQVVETYGNRNIEIRIIGVNRQALAAIIIGELDNLNNRFDKLVVKKLIPCNCQDCINKENTHFYEYDNLQRRIQNDIQTVECELSYKRIDVQSVLNGVFTFEPDDKEKIKELVENGNIDKALELLRKTHPKEASLLKSTYSKNEQLYLLGVIGRKEWNLVRQQVALAILELCKS
ncbi:COR domain-containing protein [Flavilitoribacter nigricans]|uniref:non-specific serine/threonine protein kinase n=1 Tax=Flavilitoribacter nigricans (strain ATCC 23147 / DSM 23189 / NBRC 102662 / NCIMB 1420 / SS-2) TaxID=1122177 RepID=A0A2D0N9N4_FLAN2|nr:COR domain-containing protein [Flavilitoribacter nigricans]PHN05098.1 hypothetical protein CRP01_18935 [Flavilitoribacter nigricans DSM 23189 = NBRC 102662]